MSVTVASTIAKLGKVATIGSHQPEAWRIISSMGEEQGWHLLDNHYDRHSYLAKWSERALRQEFGYRYHPVPELVNLHEMESDQHVELVDPACGLAKVSTWLDAGINCLLLCRCPNWQHCHRKFVVHLMPDSIAVELSLAFSKTVELFQRYGLLKSLPNAPGEQPVLVRTAKSQRIMLSDFGPCTMNLSVTLWLADPRYQRGQGKSVPRSQEDETSLDLASTAKRDDAQPPQQRSRAKTLYTPAVKESTVHA